MGRTGVPKKRRSGWFPCPECQDEVWATKPKLCPSCANSKYNKEKRLKRLREQYRLKKEKI